MVFTTIRDGHIRSIFESEKRSIYISVVVDFLNAVLRIVELFMVAILLYKVFSIIFAS